MVELLRVATSLAREETRCGRWVERKPRTVGDDLSAALLVVAVFAWEFLVLLAVDPLLRQGSMDTVVWHQLITAAGWSSSGLIALSAATRPGVVADRRAQQPHDRLLNRLAVVIGVVLLAISVRAVASGEMKVIEKFDTVVPDQSVASILKGLVLLLHYVADALVIVMLILFAQRAGVNRFGHVRAPWVFC